MLQKIEKWIDQTNIEHQEKRTSCAKFFKELNGFYPFEFLETSYFVIVDTIPKPSFPELYQMGLGNFINMTVHGITYKNTYYIIPTQASNLRLHFHELVHVAQWRHLGAIPFIERYIAEIQAVGYDEAPLEKMAYSLDNYFTKGGEKIDIIDYVAQKI